MNVVPQNPGIYHIAHFAKLVSILTHDEAGRPKLIIHSGNSPARNLLERVAGS